jgi:hypothetical protein
MKIGKLNKKLQPTIVLKVLKLKKAVFIASKKSLQPTKK